MDTTGQQKILVFQQRGSGESKIQGILKYGEGLFSLEIISIDQALPPVMDDTGDLLPKEMDADLVLDTSVMTRQEAVDAVLRLLTDGGWLAATPGTAR